MQIKNLIIALILILTTFSGCKEDVTDNLYYNRQYTEEIKALRKDIIFFLSANYIPGGTFAVAKDGELIYSEAFGLASKDLEVPVKRNTSC